MSQQLSLPGGAEFSVVRLGPRQNVLVALLLDPLIRVVYAMCGRRFGKTFAVAYAAVLFGLTNPRTPAATFAGVSRPRTVIAIIGPDRRRAKRVYTEIVESFKFAVESENRAEHTITLHGGAKIEIYTAENVNAIRGGGYDIVIKEEAAYLPVEGLESAVRYALLDRQGKEWNISTPKFGRRNHFNAKWEDLEKAPRQDAVTFHATTYDNPMISKADLDREKEESDPLTWQEEVEARPLEESQSPLDPSRIKLIDAKDLPPNLQYALIMDTAWGSPDRDQIDRERLRRKDATVLNVLGQDNYGNVYSHTGVWDQMLEPESRWEGTGDDRKEIKGAFEYNDQFIREFKCRWLLKEQVSEDFFGPQWRKFREMHGTPAHTVLRPTRKEGWKATGIRAFAGHVLNPGRFFMVRGNPLYGPLLDECEKYTEVKSKNDKCPDDVLTTLQDVLQPGIWQGRKEFQTIQSERQRAMIASPYDQPEDDLDGRPYESRFGII